MKKLLVTFATGFISLFSFAQKIDKIINPTEVERIERILSADDMQGRKTFTPGIDKAADFIAAEFAKSKLRYFGNLKSYFQEFAMTKSKPVEVSGSIDNEPLTTDNIAANTTAKEISINSLKDYEVVIIRATDTFNRKVFPLFELEKNLLVLVDTAHRNRFKSIQRFAGNAKFPSGVSQVFVLTGNLNPTAFNLHIKNEQTAQYLKNVIGVIPGKSRKDELVVFSGHYDHLGIGKPDKNQDSIFNGANDDAAGTTAVMMLARYFGEMKNNERTLIFVAFTAEEIGGFGSRYFSKQMNPDKVVAMFNIEMIGTESKWGTNSAYITGYEKSDMGKILQANLEGSKFHFEPDPYPKQNLFYRSDNATLAELGVPAHTISTSKMEEAPNNEPNYHKQSDEIGTLDMNNMAEIIKAIALSSKTIISGKDTPSRVEKVK
ncbi:MAG TPA: M20/M25/M40 family metallo-hydrolase [Ferruginibacter sp.]|nr:M20/M25/M40 family metallo-hydrolase [Ferruginibacter sp.]HNA15710.1 M20/M25/M40 family metallo-hydrolase [Ferruginibacter sp.]HNK27633.1 M20/M25/M40 family metallo-hydrolase [Ferruginibacter sp.]HNL65544.1 M20/M25/M40 family metallo-hydrolase [Ferruginibacter sp.]HNN70347.1 M20/M25/M40 family metallo-hydrolase [Ferruginibacter sp.]